MNTDIASSDMATHDLQAQISPLIHAAARILRLVIAVCAATAIMFVAGLVWSRPPYSPATGVGYWMGITGGSLMLILLIYPLRKRMPVLAVLGPIRHWFRLHLFAGIAGPVIVLFHSTFRVGSFNAAVALASMLLVVGSGLVGRFLYRKIHNGLYGSRRTARELQAELAAHHERLQSRLGARREISDAFASCASRLATQPPSRTGRAFHFMLLGWRRRSASRELRVQLAAWRRESGDHLASSEIKALTATMDATLTAIQRSVQFSMYERLFALWHVIHVPFLFLLVVTAVAHVVAVHAY